jgi:hypothetical protein
MRNPLPVLAAAMLAVASAFAADLPTWTVKEEPWGTWRVVNFVDESGHDRELWCRWAECSYDKKSGTAPLYVFERKSSEEYTYTEHVWKPAPASSDVSIASRYGSALWDKVVGKSSASSKTTYDTKLSVYVLDMSAQPHKAVPSKGQAVAVQDRAQAVPLGYILKVNPPSGVADDLPQAKQPAPNPNDGTTPGRRRKPGTTTPGTGTTPDVSTKPDAPTKPVGAADPNVATKPDDAGKPGPSTAAGTPGAPLTPTVPDFKNTTTHAQFNALTEAQENKLCTDVDAAGGANGCAASITDAAGVPDCMKQRGATPEATAALQKQCTQKPVCTASPSGDQPSDDLRADCRVCKANHGCKKSGKSSSMAEVATPPSASTGTDTNKPAQKGREEDKGFYNNMTNGMAAGMFGIVLGSFFGGPLVIAAFALAAGVGAYYLSKHVTKPEKKDGG